MPSSPPDSASDDSTSSSETDTSSEPKPKTDPPTETTDAGGMPASGDGASSDVPDASKSMLETPFSARVDAEEEDQLINQFYSTLQSTLTRLVDQGTAHVAQNPGAVTEIRHLLSLDPSWRRAYQIEYLMGSLYCDSELRHEIRRRMVDAKKLLDADTYQTCQTLWDDAQSRSGDDARRECEVLYARLLNDLQWRYEIRQRSRENQQGATQKTGGVFIGSAIAFILVALAGLELFIKVDCNPYIPLFYNPMVAYQVFVAMTAGLLGAMFSVLTGLRARTQGRSLDQLRLMNSLAYVATRGVVGLGGALILFYFFVSGILEGSLFPDVATAAVSNLDAGTRACDDTNAAAASVTSLENLQNNAMLVVWCFVAGFSEKLVPNLLSNTADRLDDEAVPQNTSS